MAPVVHAGGRYNRMRNHSGTFSKAAPFSSALVAAVARSARRSKPATSLSTMPRRCFVITVASHRKLCGEGSGPRMQRYVTDFVSFAVNA